MSVIREVAFLFSILCTLSSAALLYKLRKEGKVAAMRIYLRGNLSFSLFAMGGFLYAILFLLSIVEESKLFFEVGEACIFFFFFLAIFYWLLVCCVTKAKVEKGRGNEKDLKEVED
jgi:hypothetical protein